MPTRLLDLGDSNYWIKLWEPSSSLRGEYACLSHCWGEHQPLKTLAENFQTFKHEGISWDSFPKTFQEAITFSRSLNIRYLWIDSLCIIQDNNDDWNLQAANMASIYQHSLITLAATGSATCHEGLFNHPEPRETRILTARTHEKVQFRVVVRPRTNHWSDGYVNDISDEFDTYYRLPALAELLN